MPDPEVSFDQIVDQALAGPKYRAIHRGLVERIARQEVAKGRDPKETIRAIRNKLHQVTGAYLEHRPDYANWLNELQRAANSPNREDLAEACRRILRFHTSTRERLPILDEFYAQILAGLPPIHSVLDVACGLNPLAIPWMKLSPDVEYWAVDVYEDMINFLNAAMRILGVPCFTLTCDVVESIPKQRFDLAFLLKTIPCLEQIDKSAGQRLLESIRAKTLLVSFPVHSLGGRSRGMPVHYANHFAVLVAGKPWAIQRFDFHSELVFRVQKPLEE